MTIRQKIATKASELGVEFLGISDLSVANAYEHYTDWLASGRHAGMQYLEKNLPIRKDPRELLLGARTAIVIALNYYQGDKLREQPVKPRVAQYARLKDYHKVLRRKGEELLDIVLSEFPAGHVGRVVVDSAPVLERALAAKTAEGFIGKNTLYIHPRKGSFLLLAEILTSLDLPVDRQSDVTPEIRTEDGGCGTCQRCQVNCPTGALDKAYSLDANKCLAYWTIEHRGPIPLSVWPWLEQYYFGCDICQLVCPYNRVAEPTATSKALAIPMLPTLEETAVMDQAFYEKWFGGTPLTRAKKDGLQRNALIAMTVTRHPRLAEVLQVLSEPASEVLQQTVAQIREWQLGSRSS